MIHLKLHSKHAIEYHHIMNTKHLHILSHSYIDDDSRVILRPLPGRDDCQHDYINASCVDVSISNYINIHI